MVHHSIKTAFATLALAAFASTAGAACFDGHAKHVTADAKSEAEIMSTHDGKLPLPQTDSAEATAEMPVSGTVETTE